MLALRVCPTHKTRYEDSELTRISKKRIMFTNRDEKEILAIIQANWKELAGGPDPTAKRDSDDDDEEFDMPDMSS